MLPDLRSNLHEIRKATDGLNLKLRECKKLRNTYILDAYNAGYTLRAIGAEVGLSFKQVQRAVKAAEGTPSIRPAVRPEHTPEASVAPEPTPAPTESMKLLDDPFNVALTYEEQMRNNEIGQRARELRAERERNQAVRNGGRLPKPANEVYESTHGQQARYLC